MELSVDERGQEHELAALASQARGGSAEAYDALARRVRDRVRSWALGVTRDRDDAEDVAQLVLLKLHARIEQFEGRSRFTTWLYRLTRNLAFSRAHRERHRSALLATRSPEMVSSAETPVTATDEETARLTALVQYYVTELPRRQRVVYELGDIRGLNSREIAQRLGITSSTARGLLMKARRRIRLQILESHPQLVEDYTP